MSDEMQTPAQRALDGSDPQEWRDDVEMRFKLGDTQFGSIRRDVSAMRGDMQDMRAELQANTDVTSEIRDIVMAFAAFARFCKRVARLFAWLGRKLAWLGQKLFALLKLAGAVAVSVSAIWALIWAALHGIPPPEGKHEGLPGHESPTEGRSNERPFSSSRK